MRCGYIFCWIVSKEHTFWVCPIDWWTWPYCDSKHEIILTSWEWRNGFIVVQSFSLSKTRQSACFAITVSTHSRICWQKMIVRDCRILWGSGQRIVRYAPHLQFELSPRCTELSVCHIITGGTMLSLLSCSLICGIVVMLLVVGRWCVEQVCCCRWAAEHTCQGARGRVVPSKGSLLQPFRVGDGLHWKCCVWRLEWTFINLILCWELFLLLNFLGGEHEWCYK